MHEPSNRLLGSQKLDKATAKMVKAVRLANMLVQADAQELRQNENAIDTAVDTIGNRDID